MDTRNGRLFPLSDPWSGEDTRRRQRENLATAALAANDAGKKAGRARSVPLLPMTLTALWVIACSVVGIVGMINNVPSMTLYPLMTVANVWTVIFSVIGIAVLADKIPGAMLYPTMVLAVASVLIVVSSASLVS